MHRHMAWALPLLLVAIYFVSMTITSLISNYGIISYLRTTGSMYFCDSSGMTLDWHIRSIQMTLWTWIPQCWTPFGNPTCSLQTKREQTSMRLRQTTNCFGYSRMEMSFTASGDHVFFVFFKIKMVNLAAPASTYFSQTSQIQFVTLPTE